MKRTTGIAENDYARLRILIRQIFEESYQSYGYRRITAVLKSRGYNVNHKLVYRLMREEGIKCDQRTKRPEEDAANFGSYSKRWGTKGEDLIHRNFEVKNFGEVWVTDMSEIRAGRYIIYLTVVIDLFNTEIVGYCIADEPKLKPVLEAIRYAHYQFGSAKPIVHSDRGWFYCANYYINLLNEYGYTRSMSESGSCYDNAVAERFFAQLKTELIYQREWKSEQLVKREIHKYIKYYNTKRIKASLDYQTPEAVRIQWESEQYI